MSAVTGYRTNADNTETLAWEEGADGLVTCDHDARRCCLDCVDADSRLTWSPEGVRVGLWPSNASRDGRTVTYRIENL